MLQIKTHIKIRQHLPIIATSILVVVGLVTVPQVFADELTISGNGAESKSEVKVESSQQTSVQQNNTADVKNDVKVDANTGNNEASDNTGGSNTINTGDANSSTSISNNTNVSSVNIDHCDNCGRSGSVSISGNGAYSDNKVNVHSSWNNSINVNQDAHVTNNVYEDLITGKNKANDNTDGDVSIDTGDIRTRQNIFNELLNFSDISIAGSPFHDFLVKIFGNGAFSDNHVKTDITNDNTVAVNNTVDLINDLKSRYVTGENEASNNTGGNVEVATGDITSEVNIRNVANISKVKIGCDCEQENPTPTPTTVAPTPSTSSGPTATGAPAAAVSSPTPSSQSAGQVLGASAILPVTGSNLFFFMMIANVVMMLMGAYLRLRSGNSPGMV